MVDSSAMRVPQFVPRHMSQSTRQKLPANRRSICHVRISHPTSFDILVDKTEKLFETGLHTVRCPTLKSNARYDSENNVISSSYVSTHRCKHKTRIRDPFHEIDLLCSQMSSEQIGNASEETLGHILRIIPQICLSPMQKNRQNFNKSSIASAQNMYSNVICDTLSELASRDALFHEKLLLEDIFRIFRMASMGVDTNDALFDPQTLASHHSGGYLFERCKTYNQPRRESLYVFLIDNPRTFHALHKASLQEALHQMRANLHTLCGKNHTVVKRAVKQIPWLHPKNLILLLEWTVDASFSIERQNQVARDQDHIPVIGHFMNTIYEPNLCSTLLSIYPVHYRSRLAIVLLYGIMGHEFGAKCRFDLVEDIFHALEYVHDDIPGRYLLGVLQALRFTKVKLALRIEPQAEEMQQRAMRLLIILGDVAGKRADEISPTHRFKILAIFQSVSGEHGKEWCKGLEKVLLSSVGV